MRPRYFQSAPGEKEKLETSETMGPVVSQKIENQRRNVVLRLILGVVFTMEMERRTKHSEADSRSKIFSKHRDSPWSPSPRRELISR